MLPPPGHIVSVRSARTLPLPPSAELRASTDTGPHCCRLEDQRREGEGYNEGECSGGGRETGKVDGSFSLLIPPVGVAKGRF